MKFIKTQNLRISLLLLLILSFLSSCGFFRSIFGGKQSRSKNRKSEQAYIAPKNDNDLVKKSPEEIRLEALSFWNSGLVYQKQFHQTKNIDYAKIAIDKYEKYYSLQPNGTYAGSALIRMAELAYYLGDKNRALHELNRIKSRQDLKYKYFEEIKLIEYLIKK